MAINELIIIIMIGKFDRRKKNEENLFFLKKRINLKQKLMI